MTDAENNPPPESSTFDPVCGEILEQDRAVASYEHDGRTFYFKHIKCKLLFERDPASYLDDGVPKVAPRAAGESPDSGAPASVGGVSRYGIVAGIGCVAVLLVAGSFLVFGGDQAESGSDDRQPTAADSVVAPDAAANPAGSSGETVALGESSAPEEAPAHKEPSVVVAAKEADDDVSPKARAQLDRGRKLLEANKIRSAVAELENCIQTAPELAEAYVVLGVAYRRQERHKVAVEAFLTYLRLSPDAADIDRVRHLMQATGQSARTLGAPKIDPKSTAAVAAQSGKPLPKLDRRKSPGEQYEVGNRYLAKNELRLAVAAFRRTIALDPSFAEAYAALSIAYRRQDRHKRAGETMITYLSLIRSSANAERVRRTVDEHEPAKQAQP